MGSRQTGDRNLFEVIKRRNQSIFGLEMVTTQSLDHVLRYIYPSHQVDLKSEQNDKNKNT